MRVRVLRVSSGELCLSRVPPWGVACRDWRGPVCGCGKVASVSHSESPPPPVASSEVHSACAVGSVRYKFAELATDQHPGPRPHTLWTLEAPGWGSRVPGGTLGPDLQRKPPTASAPRPCPAIRCSAGVGPCWPAAPSLAAAGVGSGMQGEASPLCPFWRL